MRILLTGAGGFLGSNLLQSFSKKHEVLSLKLRKNTCLDKLKKEILSFKPDVFINCGWSSANNYDNTNDYSQFDNITMGVAVFEILSSLKELSYVGFGSFSEYGSKTSKISEINEENPTSLYGISKNTFKHMSKLMCEKHSFNWLWLRPCYIYGENDVPTRLIPKVFESCLKNNKIILNSCESKVDYLYIQDFVEAVSLLVDNKHSGVFNICSGNEYKVKDVVESIKRICKFQGEIIFDSKKDRKNFPDYICGDNSKLKQSLNWSPKYELTEGLLLMRDYYIKNQYYKDMFLNGIH